ncbi:hypothetical protein DFH07DRAFT_13414 [Mycena maculata]|uniref:Glycan binding protein Y3-like domain-containing protein n=1 Tax=Mycena maculata TaxID=230809 RepID=A0AAD7N543_9AGAR|nr:hypothetical protein DFH07DRAFT_13414 [Mycena maculata]
MFTTYHVLLRFVSFAVIVAPGLGQLSSACFDQGTVGDCSSFVAQFCANAGQNSVGPSDTMAQCFNTPDKSFKCDLAMVNTLSSVTGPDVANCETALTTISQDCPMVSTLF